MRLLIGLMSGTSMDGIDAALVDVNTNTLIAGITRPYSAEAQQRLREILGEEHTSAAKLSQLNTVLGREFAQAVNQLLNKANTLPDQIMAIGSHGQTICHDATSAIPCTVQLGCGHTIAELTGITVVADFRTRDLVIGGQGAPFAPVYHQALFEQLTTPTAVVNVGGIANVTFLAPDMAVSGYDTGPGNCLMDAQAQKHLHQSYDENGAWAATGQVIEPLLSSMLSDPYFALPAPKSLDKAYFSQGWLAQHLRVDDAIQDVQATLVALTATTICQAIKSSDLPIERVVLCGGGVHNVALLQAIRHQLPSLQVESTQALGVDPDFLEAMMFAWLADKTVNQIPVDLTAITGASRPTLLGAIYPKNSLPTSSRSSADQPRDVERALFTEIKNHPSPGMHTHLRQRFPELEIAELDDRIREFLRFIYISSIKREAFLLLSEDVDAIWHEYILQTKEYAQLCMDLPGKLFIHHQSHTLDSYFEQLDRKTVVQNMLEWLPYYYANFGEFTEKTAQYWTMIRFLSKELHLSLCQINQLARDEAISMNIHAVPKDAF